MLRWRLPATMDRSRTAVGVGLGVLVSVVGGFLPFVSLVAPLLGGGVAGALQRAGLRAGARAGALVGGVLAALGVVLSALGPFLPAIPAAVVLGPWARAFGLGLLDSAAASLVVSAVLLVVVGALGGAVGGALARRRSPQSSRTTG
jgi:hypothetical protein